ncbi:MAG: hypothetical protein IT581_03000 [Verrucomicrobiales bacterium]|nr:hypothetical protein [Verrucomicrobiales bacterium]
MTDPIEIAETLRGHLVAYRRLLQIVEAEGGDLRSGQPAAWARHSSKKKDLLPVLVGSLDPLVKCRAAWQAVSPAERSRHPEVDDLVKQNQDLLMKILFLDRENEQALLRQGLVPPRELPSVNRQRPNFVTDLYRRQGGR